MNQETGDFSDLIQNILSYKGRDGITYINRFNKTWLLNHIEEKDAIQLLEDEFKNFDPKGLDAVDFAKAFLNIVSHTEDETLYLVVGIIDLYKDICETFDLKGTIKSSDVLNYIVESFGNREWKTHVIATRKLPAKKRFDADHTKIRAIDIEAPLVYGNHNGGIMRLINSKLMTDSTAHTRSIKRACLGLEIKKVFTLDSLAGSISMYNLNCVLEKRISPKLVNQKSEIMVLDFAWSDKQQRIGATLKDFSLSFWDATDNFDFEKSVHIAKWIPDYQCNIWYIEFLNLWVTTDNKTHMVNAWDIEKEAKLFSLASPKVKSNIIDVVAIEILKLVAVSSMDKIITIWDFRRQTIIMELDLAQGGIHSMVWSNSYQVLVTAGYENNINLWSINPIFLDTTLVGKLTGHTAMVTALEIIEKTAMIVSADDSGKLKVWDLRNLQCVQTVEVGPKAYISKLINLYMFDKLCFIGSRVNMLQFDRNLDAGIKRKGEDEAWPLRVEFNHGLNEIVICTRKDVRFVDVNAGRVKKIYQGLLSNDEDDITVFRLVQQDKKFILGDYRGQLGLYSYATGEKLKSFAPHANEVTGLKVDFANKLIVSSGWDSTVMIQKESKMAHEVKRTIKNLHYNKEISIMEISVYHNLLVTAANSNMIYVWDYEYMKLMATIECDEGTEPTYITFLNGYSYMIIADSCGRIYFVHFHKKDVANISLRKVACLSACAQPRSFEEVGLGDDTSNFFVNKILIEKQSAGSSEKGDSLKMFISTNKGDIKIYDISDLIKLDFIKLVPHTNTSMNYNSDRINHEDFLTQIQSYKTYTFSLGSKRAPLSQNTSPKEQDTDCISLEKSFLGEFKAHKDSLTTLTTVGTPDTKLLTSSIDGYIKIWTLEGTLVGSLNINHPLPTCWNLKIDDFIKNKKKVLFALKLIDRIFKRYENKMLLSEQRNISVNRFLKSFVDPVDEYDAEKHYDRMILRQDTCALGIKKKAKVRLMKDEYTPRDLQYEKAKIIYKKELQGPSLRQMEVTQRLAEAQKAWKSEKITENNTNRPDEDFLRVREAEDRKEKNDFMSFLLGDNKKALLADVNYSKKTRTLAKKLDSISSGVVSPGRRKKETLLRKDSLNSNKRGSFFLTSMNDSIGRRRYNNTPSPYDRLSVSIDPAASPTLSKGPSKKEDNKETREAGAIRDPSKKSTFKLQKVSSKAEPASPVAKIPRTKKNIDFIEYAAEKLSSRSDIKAKLSSQRAVLSQSLKSEEYIRKLRRQNFHNIITSIDQTVKKYQINSPSLKNLQLTSLDSNRMLSEDRICRTQATPDKELNSGISLERYHLRLGSEPEVSDFTKRERTHSPRQMTIGRIKSLDGAGKKSFTNFGDELISMKGAIEDSWNLNVTRTDRVKNHLSEIVNSQKTKDTTVTGNDNSYGFTKSRLLLEPSTRLETSGMLTPVLQNMHRPQPNDINLPEMSLSKAKSVKAAKVRIWKRKESRAKDF